MNEYVTVRNTVTGGVGKVRRWIAEHSLFGKVLEIVPDGTKPTVPLKVLVDKKRTAPVVPDKAPETDEDGK